MFFLHNACIFVAGDIFVSVYIITFEMKIFRICCFTVFVWFHRCVCSYVLFIFVYLSILVFAFLGIFFGGVT